MRPLSCLSRFSAKLKSENCVRHPPPIDGGGAERQGGEEFPERGYPGNRSKVFMPLGI